MKTLNSYLESLLDVDFDINDSDITLAQAGWYIERAESSAYLMGACDRQRMLEISGLKCNQISGQSPWKKFEEIGAEMHIKCTCRDSWNNLKYVFAHWLLAFMYTARADEKAVNDTITELTGDLYKTTPKATVKLRGGKLYIKGEWEGRENCYGKKAKLSITLSQRPPENRIRFYK